jgi:hypothetical protein
MSQKPDEHAAQSKPSRIDWLEVIKVGFPLVFGFIIWNAQTRIQEKVDGNTLLIQDQLQAQQALRQAQLALKEEYHKRRLTIYENACKQIAETENSLADVGMTTESVTHAIDLIGKLDKLRKGNRLYWSPQLDVHLDKLWRLGICKVQGVPCEYSTGEVLDVDALPQEIAKQVTGVHEQMKEDLDIPEMAKALHMANKAAREDK